MDKAELMGEMLKQADVDKTQARVELAQALEELARLKAEAKEARGACYIASEQRDQARAERDSFQRQARAHKGNGIRLLAERDAALEALARIVKYCKDGVECAGEECPIWEHGVARKALASLPQAAERAQAQRDVIAAARAFLEAGASAGANPEKYLRLCGALARLDALESGGG